MAEVVVPQVAASVSIVSSCWTVYVPPQAPPALALIGIAKHASRSNIRTEVRVKVLCDMVFLLISKCRKTPSIAMIRPNNPKYNHRKRVIPPKGECHPAINTDKILVLPFFPNTQHLPFSAATARDGIYHLQDHAVKLPLRIRPRPSRSDLPARAGPSDDSCRASSLRRWLPACRRFPAMQKPLR